MPKLQRSRVRSQHPSAQWNLRGGRWSSADYCTNKKKKIPQKNILKKYIYIFLDARYNVHYIKHKKRWNVLTASFVQQLSPCGKLTKVVPYSRRRSYQIVWWGRSLDYPLRILPPWYKGNGKKAIHNEDRKQWVMINEILYCRSQKTCWQTITKIDAKNIRIRFLFKVPP